MGSDPRASGMGFRRNHGRRRYPPTFGELQRSAQINPVAAVAPNGAHPNGYRRLPAVKANTSFENIDRGFSSLNLDVGCIAAEPLVVPVQMAVYIIKAPCATSQSGLSVPDTHIGLGLDAASRIISFLGWAPTAKQSRDYRVPMRR